MIKENNTPNENETTYKGNTTNEEISLGKNKSDYEKNREKKLDKSTNDQELPLEENNIDDNNEEEISLENIKKTEDNTDKQEVEVDKIFKLLQDAKKEIKDKSTYEKNKKERLDQIINEIPKNSLHKFNDNSKEQGNRVNHEEQNKTIKSKNTEQPNKPADQKSCPKGFSFLLLIIIAALGYLQYDNYNNVNNSNTPVFSDLEPSIQNNYILKSESKFVENKLKFNHLANKIQEQYILKKDHINTQKHANLLIKKSRALAEQNKILKKKVAILKNKNNINDNNKKNNNRNLLKEVNLLKVEQEGYTNKIVSLRISQKKNLSKVKKLIAKNKKMETTTKKNVSKIKKLTVKNKQLKISQQENSKKVKQLTAKNKNLVKTIQNNVSNINQLTSQKEQITTKFNKFKKAQMAQKTSTTKIISVNEMEEKSVKTVVAKSIQEKPKKSVNKYDEIVSKELFPAVKSTSKDYKFVKCYDVKAGDFYLTSKCKKDITQFIEENKSAKRLEIIGVVDNNDFTSLYNQNPKTNNSLLLQKFNAMGLSRYRVLETSWFISNQLKSTIALTPVNYTITSKKSNRGAIVRAYYK